MTPKAGGGGATGRSRAAESPLMQELERPDKAPVCPEQPAP